MKIIWRIALVLFIMTSPMWAATNVVRHPYQYYKEASCRWCGSTNGLQVHHIIGQKSLIAMGLFNDLVNDPRILCTFCAACHLLVAHCGDFHVENGQLAVMLQKKCGYTGVYYATNFVTIYGESK